MTVGTLQLSEPTESELLIRIEAAGVCHSDLSVVNGDRKRPVPMLLGHEAAGIVEQVGSTVTDMEVGQRVVMTFLPRCGECANCATNGRLPCIYGSKANEAGSLLNGSRHLSREGKTIQHHLGVSGFATHAVVDRASVVPVGDDVPPEVAAVLGCAVLTGGGALLNAIAPTSEDTIMIIGLGGVGMAALLTAFAIGLKKIIAVDTSLEKLELAHSMGANQVYTSAEVADQEIKADHVLECAGHPMAFETAFNATKPGGKTVTAGLPSPEARSKISPLTITSEARTIIGSYLGSSVPSRDIPRYEEMWRSGKLPVEKLITSHIGLEEINTAMDELAEGKAVRQVILFDSQNGKL